MIVDILANDIALLDTYELIRKYKKKIPEGIMIKDILQSIEKQGLLNFSLKKDWNDDGRDRKGLYLIRVENHFEVFTGERGIKNWKQEFGDIKEACFVFIDCLLNECFYSAPDSKIN